MYSPEDLEGVPKCPTPRPNNFFLFIMGGGGGVIGINQRGIRGHWL